MSCGKRYESVSCDLLVCGEALEEFGAVPTEEIVMDLEDDEPTLPGWRLPEEVARDRRPTPRVLVAVDWSKVP